MKISATEIAKTFSASDTLGEGQLCTNQVFVVDIGEEKLQQFISAVGNEIRAISPSKMLHSVIAKAFTVKNTKALAQEDVMVIATSQLPTTTGPII